VVDPSARARLEADLKLPPAIWAWKSGPTDHGLETILGKANQGAENICRLISPIFLPNREPEEGIYRRSFFDSLRQEIFLGIFFTPQNIQDILKHRFSLV
jgi:hypothetical protein